MARATLRVCLRSSQLCTYMQGYVLFTPYIILFVLPGRWSKANRRKVKTGATACGFCIPISATRVTSGIKQSLAVLNKVEAPPQRRHPPLHLSLAVRLDSQQEVLRLVDCWAMMASKMWGWSRRRWMGCSAEEESYFLAYIENMCFH